MKKLSFQLYSARKTKLSEALSIIADAGYSAVEAYADNIDQLTEFKAGLSATGLSVSSIHIGREELARNMPDTLALASELGSHHIVCPYLKPEERPDNKQGWLELATELADNCAQINSVGFDFAWHNHDFEFDFLSDGSLPMRLLLDNVPEMQWEIDVGWIQRASQDPASWLRTYADRVSAVHLKDVAADGECSDEDGWADVGFGVVNWDELVTEFRRLETDLFIVEHDCPSDLKRFATRSIQTFRSWK